MSFVNRRVKRGDDIIDKLWPLLVPGRAHIAGGFARWACSPNKKPYQPSDIDIFCLNLAVYAKMDTRLRKRFTWLQENEACSVYGTGWKKVRTVQLIKPREQHAVVTMGPIKRILNNFDFTVTRAAITKPRTVVVDADFAEHEGKRKLVIKNIHCPVSSLFRIIKYCKKGYKISMAEAVKLFIDWQNRSEEYRLELIELITKESPSDEDINHLEMLLRVD